MLLEQQKISKIRKSTQFYRNKIRGYRGSRPYVSPSPAPSADESLLNLRSPTPSMLTDVSGVEEEALAPSEHLEPPSFPTYSPSTATPRVCMCDYNLKATVHNTRNPSKSH